MTLEAGAALGRYRIDRAVGAGAMGEVYLAVDPKLGREVALKVLPSILAADPERLARFQREAQVLASLNHPCVASIHGLEEADGQPFLVLEYVPGEDLAERLAGGPLPIDEALEIARQIAEGLEEAHEKGIVHRDLKPANVKVTPEDKVKVLDFGLAKAFAGEGAAAGSDPALTPTLSLSGTVAGVILGSPGYMAPEQARGKPADKRADVWAFGVVLWEMLTGRRLFDGETVSDSLASILRSEIDWSALPPGTPPRVAAMLRRCLERDPRRRLRDIGEARIVLETPHELEPPEDPASGADLAGARRSTRIAWALAAVALLLAAFSWLGAPRQRARTDLPAPSTRLHVDLGATVAEGLGASAVLSPDGRRVVFQVLEEESRTPVLYLRNLDQLRAVRIDGTEGARQPFFSPNGEWIGYFSGDSLAKVPIGGGAPTSLAPTVFDTRGGAWLADDTIVFAPTQTSPLLRLPADGGVPQPLTTLDDTADERSHRWPHALPDGRTLLFNVQKGNSSFDLARIEALDVSSGDRKLLLEGGMAPLFSPTGHLLFVRQGTLYAAPFDPVDVTLLGDPVPIEQGVASDRRNGSVQLSLGGDSLLFLQGGELRDRGRLVLGDSTGATTVLLDELDGYASPRFSPDGRQVAVARGPVRREDLWIVDVATGTPRRLTFDDGSEDEPVWTPDGRRILYRAQRDDGTLELRWTRADGGGEPESLLAQSGAGDRFVPLVFTPGGERLIFQRSGPAGSRSPWDLWVLDLADRHAEPLLEEEDVVTRAHLSADGRWLVHGWEKLNDSDEGLLVRPFLDLDTRWQISDQGLDPRWTAGGRRIVFSTFSSPEDAWWAVDVDETGDGLSFSPPRLLFRGRFAGSALHPTWDVDATGERFALIEPENDQPADRNVVLVQGWTRELARRVPVNGH